jgi:hypothetical protein
METVDAVPDIRPDGHIPSRKILSGPGIFSHGGRVIPDAQVSEIDKSGRAAPNMKNSVLYQYRLGPGIREERWGCTRECHGAHSEDKSLTGLHRQNGTLHPNFVAAGQ